MQDATCQDRRKQEDKLKTWIKYKEGQDKKQRKIRREKDITETREDGQTARKDKRQTKLNKGQQRKNKQKEMKKRGGQKHSDIKHKEGVKNKKIKNARCYMLRQKKVRRQTENMDKIQRRARQEIKKDPQRKGYN
eukprot:TRINITY_DN25592_c0_g1_i1.p4 TRINITY_DN25592_c0_g1~~TRINITY_DN25592_c0_g1_i1.p4  ORF type:complete len:135 (+),score=26.75 TRINITY_DN25592_c0_g1_i1:115-519(+)